MGDRDDIREGEEPGLDDGTRPLAEQTQAADEAAKAAAKLRDEDDPDNASSETS
jgi:hypothetical protein